MKLLYTYRIMQSQSPQKEQGMRTEQQPEPNRKGSEESEKKEHEVEKISEDAEKKAEDAKSVFVQNVDYASTKQELEIVFEDCGSINRITILRDKYTNTPKGNAYVEFNDIESVEHALMLSGTRLRNRAIKVSHKRTNIRGMSRKNNTLPRSDAFMLLSKVLKRGRGR